MHIKGGPFIQKTEDTMRLRVSVKLGKKIGVEPTESSPLHANLFLDWSGHLFRANRRQHIILTNTASLYSLLFLGRGITTPEGYADRARHEIQAFLQRDGYADVWAQFIAPHDSSVSFSKALNRTVIGSVNDMIFAARVHIEGHGRTLREVSDAINKMPMSCLEEVYPHRAFQALRDDALRET